MKNNLLFIVLSCLLAAPAIEARSNFMVKQARLLVQNKKACGVLFIGVGLLALNESRNHSCRRLVTSLKNGGLFKKKPTEAELKAQAEAALAREAAARAQELNVQRLIDRINSAKAQLALEQAIRGFEKEAGALNATPAQKQRIDSALQELKNIHQKQIADLEQRRQEQARQRQEEEAKKRAAEQQNASSNGPLNATDWTQLDTLSKKLDSAGSLAVDEMAQFKALLNRAKSNSRNDENETRIFEAAEASAGLLE
jgi:hypothetical protein